MSDFIRYNIVNGEKESKETVQIKITNTLLDHKLCGYVYCHVYFEKQKKLVTTCSDSKIRIFDSTNLKKLHTCSEQKSYILHIIKWNSESFISGSYDKTIKIFSIHPPYECTNTFTAKRKVFRLLKLNDDLFIARTPKDELYVFSVSKNSLLKILVAGRLSSLSNVIIKSKKYANCFYLPCQGNQEIVKLVDYEKEIVSKEFKSHSNEERIFIIESFLNSQKEEVLIVCDTVDCFYFYNTNRSIFDTNIELKDIVHIKRKIKNKLNPEKVLSCIGVNDQFLFLGDDTGKLFFFEFLCDFKMVKRHRVLNLHNEVITFVDIKDFSAHESKMNVITCSCDKILKITEISGFTGKRNDIEEDNKERSMYLQNEMDNFEVFEKKLFIELKFNFVKFSCFKIFLYYQ